MRSSNAVTSPYKGGPGLGEKKAAPRERGSLERAGLTGFVGRDPNPRKNPEGKSGKPALLLNESAM